MTWFVETMVKGDGEEFWSPPRMVYGPVKLERAMWESLDRGDNVFKVTRANDGSYYLIHMGQDIVKCSGDQATAEEHLRHIRNWHITTYKAAHNGSPPETVPWLIGVYGPDAVGGPEGKGGVFSYGYKWNLIGSINQHPDEWLRLT